MAESAAFAFARLAQWKQRYLDTVEVGGSIPPARTKVWGYDRVRRCLKPKGTATDAGSIPASSTIIKLL